VIGVPACVQASSCVLYAVVDAKPLEAEELPACVQASGMENHRTYQSRGRANMARRERRVNKDRPTAWTHGRNL
jgi:hypothetical protein